MDTRFTRSTVILDINHPRVQALVAKQGWLALPLAERIGAVYAFARDEIAFGYNHSDDLPASAVLADGYGQCNTKASLLMALLRAVNVPCRLHGATIHKRLQRGVMEGIAYRLSPDEILHSWAEVRMAGRWVELEGVILDDAYLEGLRKRVRASGPLLGYGAGTLDVTNPPIMWRGENTAIQKTGIARDLGVYDDPDAFYRRYGVNASGIQRFLFSGAVRHLMNRRVRSIRG